MALPLSSIAQCDSNQYRCLLADPTELAVSALLQGHSIIQQCCVSGSLNICVGVLCDLEKVLALTLVNLVVSWNWECPSQWLEPETIKLGN